MAHIRSSLSLLSSVLLTWFLSAGIEPNRQCNDLGPCDGQRGCCHWWSYC
jgi:hypothetical protein